MTGALEPARCATPQEHLDAVSRWLDKRRAVEALLPRASDSGAHGVHPTLQGEALAEVRARLDALHPADASATKAFGTEFYLEAIRACQEILGQAGYLPRDSAGAFAAGQIEQAWRGLLILTFGGGTNELQRDIIAMFGLGMPRADR